VAIVLVLAGDYQQYLGWMRMVYGPKAAAMKSAPRYVGKVEDLYGLRADGVVVFHQIGTYWDNPVWGSEPYRLLMEEGEIEGRPWAMSWTTDWTKACAMREPLDPEVVRDARRRLARVIEELGDDD
jgi:hypothetical protein